MIITGEMIQARLNALQAAHSKLLNDIQATWGAIQEAEFWLKTLNEVENASNSSSSSPNICDAGTPTDSSDNPDNG